MNVTSGVSRMGAHVVDQLTASDQAFRKRRRRSLALLSVLAVILALSVSWRPRAAVAAAGDVVTVTAVSDTHLSTGSAGSGERGVAGLVTATPSEAVLMPGDLSDTGTASDFAAFDELYGSAKAKIRPAPGNHDFSGTDAAAYFNYFGPIAGSVNAPWYSFDLGTWHVVSLAVAPDPGAPDYWSAGAPQLAWLAGDLEAHPSQPTVAVFHRPRFSGAAHGDSADITAIWNVLYAHHVELTLNGHDNAYQRFAPQDPTGAAASDGVREFVVATGGAAHYAMSHYTSGHNLEAWNNTAYGVTTLTLGPASYSWRFTASDGSAWTDTGTSPVNPQHQPTPGNHAPVANAGPDQSVQAGSSGSASVTLDGSLSTDPDGDSLAYAWSEAGVPLGGGAVVQVGLAVGVHVVTLAVTDPGGLTGTDEVVVTVLGSVHVAALTDASGTVARNKWRPAVTVAVATESGTPAVGATVTFRITGLVTATSSCTTDTSGTCVLTAALVKRHGTVTFTVTGINATARTYRPTENVLSSLTVTH